MKRFRNKIEMMNKMTIWKTGPKYFLESRIGSASMSTASVVDHSTYVQPSVLEIVISVVKLLFSVSKFRSGLIHSPP